MASYQDVSWGDDDLIVSQKLNQMASNERYLFDNTANLKYNAFGIVKTTGLKIASGIVSMGPSTANTIYQQVYFGDFFTPGCVPVINITHSGTGHVYKTIGGLTRGQIKPDHQGFTIMLEAQPPAATKNYFPIVQHVHWMAIGY